MIKVKINFVVIFLFSIFSLVQAQIVIDQDEYNWSRIESTLPVNMVYTDDDNGDGYNDGAILIKGAASSPSLQGVKYSLSGSPVNGEQINIEAKYFQESLSFVKFKMQIYNVTDNMVLAETSLITTTSGVVGTCSLSYTFGTSDTDDQIAVRFVRADDLNTARMLALDYVKINGKFVNMVKLCKPIFDFDLPLNTATASEVNDLKIIRNSLSNQLLGTTKPTVSQLNKAIAEYNALNIVVTGNTISGNPIANISQINFLRIFAQHLKFNPTDTNISDKAVKAVWYLASQNCNDKSNSVLTFYNYPKFSRAAIFLNDYLPDHVKALFGNTLFTETDSFRYLFDLNYDFNTTLNNGAINTDIIYLHIDVLFAYADWFKTNDQKIRYLKTVKRFLERFLIYTGAAKDGLKKDGLSFRHNASYDGYMYAFNTVSVVLKSLENTGLQIDVPSYLRFRNAIYAQALYSNDLGVKPFSMAGRNPQIKTTTLSSQTLSNTAISGGEILGLNSADPLLAGIYNRRYGINDQFNNTVITPFEQGFIQFNYGNLGIYRKNNWIASMKGQSDKLWGAEIYASQNRFGRYQSYGALEIIYPGNSTTGNGYTDIGWDWNYNPGATTIVLPWNKLHAEKERIDEYNTYGFAGALILNKANEGALSDITGQSGMFSMKFKERSDLGFGITYGPNTHNSTFEFTKTYFAINDYIVCLGSGIKNNDDVNPTVTTLFQRLNNNSSEIFVNNEIKTNQSTEAFSDTQPNWIIDNYNTGYYIVPGSGKLKIKNSIQKTPYQNQVNPSDKIISDNQSNDYHLAYLDHGTAPKNSFYEFVCIPSANGGRMNEFAQEMESVQGRPYVVYQNNTNQQIIKHRKSKTWGYALPTINTTIMDGLVISNDTPCLVMYKELNKNSSEIILSISNPDLGIAPFTSKTIVLTLRKKWKLIEPNSKVNIISVSDTETVIAFTVADGLPVEVNLLEIPCVLSQFLKIETLQPANSNSTGSIRVTDFTAGSIFSLDGITFDNPTGFFQNLNPGNYTVYEKNANGCVFAVTNALINSEPSSLSKLVTTSSVNKALITSSNLTIGPNPVYDYLIIQVPKLEINARISLYDYTGKKIRDLRFTNLQQKISMRDLPAGMYLISIQNGRFISNKKINKL